MARGLQRRSGGIIALFETNEKTNGALEADIAERLHVSMHAIPSTIGWRSVCVWSRHIARDCASHTWRALNDKRADFANGAQQSEILASIYDVIAAQNALLSSHFSRKAYRRPKPYPRPYRSGNTEVYGRDPIPIYEFDSWYYGR